MAVAIVTGSDSGIGKATAVALAHDGYAVDVTWHRDEKGAQATADEVESLGMRSEVRRLDLTELPGCADVIDELADALGGIDVFVNNSGTSRRAPTGNEDADVEQESRDGNLCGSARRLGGGRKKSRGTTKL